MSENMKIGLAALILIPVFGLIVWSMVVAERQCREHCAPSYGRIHCETAYRADGSSYEKNCLCECIAPEDGVPLNQLR